MSPLFAVEGGGGYSERDPDIVLFQYPDLNLDSTPRS